MVQRKSWEEFRKSGLLLFVNQFLHIFGWAIVLVYEKDIVIDLYPARVKFRGFDNKDTDEAYKKISEYMADNSQQLYIEAHEE